jgi:NADPH-dependent 2,4-dienoyl-CoA reductase/sulfur reductase-like enzyme
LNESAAFYKEKHMKAYTYVIVGGGMAADSAVKGIREVDKTGTIALIGKEDFPPYDRPPLTKKLWTGKKQLEDIWRKTASHNVDLYLNQRVVSIDPKKKVVTDDGGLEYEYKKLLLATGGKPRRLPFGGDLVQYFRSLKDYQDLRARAEQGVKEFVVIGGGFIGSELAAALTIQAQKVTIIFPGQGIGDNVFPPGLAQHINDYYRSKGITVLAGEEVSAVEQAGSRVAVKTKSGKSIEADHVVAGIGITPNVELAQAIGLEVDNGIHVGEDLQTSHADIYAAGDVANFANSYLGGRTRVEHEDNTNTMGKLAGYNMAGKPTPYTHLPMFYSDLFDMGYEAVGKLDSKLTLVEDWKEQPYKKGVVYYLDGSTLRGVLLWNVWDQVDAARDLIRSVTPHSAKDLAGKI